MTNQNNDLQFEYTFQFSKEKVINFKITLDGGTLAYKADEPAPKADWARLENRKCENCPLNPANHAYCPIALNLGTILTHFRDIYSYEKVNVMVTTAQRIYALKTSIQHGLSSLIGIIMVSSGCPVMSQLRPMVRFHLPFASVTETVYRAASTYLLGEYFKFKNGQSVDWDLNGLIQIYKDVQIVNHGMANRLRTIESKDANINALIVLDVFAKELPLNIEHKLNSIEYIYKTTGQDQ